MKRFLPLALSAVFAIGIAGTTLRAQSVTAGDIRGSVTDPTGAVIPNAEVLVKNNATGASQTASSGSGGSYRVSLLSPGSYTVSVTAAGFTTITTTVSVAAGEVTTDDVKLTLGSGNSVIEVTGEPIIVNTENGDVTTSFTAEEIQSLPNPGNDLTYVAQTAPGSVMNTGTAAGGYGNFSSFGISGLSNMFTLDGGYENDPFLNLNNTGASNLTLGNNEVDTVTVISPAYSSQFGGLGGAQVNEITMGGGNRLHGNANYYWDGRALNSNDWFNKQNQVFSGTKNIPAFVNANQWGAAIGGPIMKDKLFFFVNTEGIRAVTPQQGQVYVPNLAFQNCALGKDPGGTVSIPGAGTNGTAANITYTSCAGLNSTADKGCITGSNAAGVGNLCDGIPFAAAASNQQPLLGRIFGVYNTSPYRPATVSQDPNDPSASSYYAHAAALLTEWLLTARVDYRIGAKDNFYIHYKQDHGIQPTYTDLISPLFTDSSPQPAWEGQMNETHTFSTNLTNQLVLTGNYYSAPFQNNNNPATLASSAPSTVIFISGDIGNQYYGGIDYDFPQGRRVAGYQVIDDLSYTKGKNTLRLGYNFRRDNITDIQGVETTSTIAETTAESFSTGLIDYEFIQRFPQRPTQPVAVYNEGAYVEDAYKVASNLTLTAGLRFEKNSNPTCITNCFSVLANPIGSIPTSTSAPYNAAVSGGLISANRHQAFTGYQSFAVMPRIGFNWQPGKDSKTVVRGGFGMFTDTFPGLIADTLLSNAPDNFHAAVFGPVAGGANFLNLDPSTPGSGASVAIASNAAFQSAFKNGGTEATTAAAVAAAGGHYSVPSIATVANSVKYPTYEEYSVAVERRIDSHTSISASYVGNHGYHEPVENGGNNLSNSKASAAFFPTIPTAKPIASFATVTNIYSGASSNFNGVVLSAVRRSSNLTLQFNYEFSKALDEISNGGLEPFAPDAGDATTVQNPGNLHQQYGVADYNVKQNTTGAFVYNLPYIVKKYKSITGGFEFSGNVFHQTGLPYTIGQSSSSGIAAFANGSVNLYAKQLNNNFDHHCGGGNHALLPDGSAPNKCNFVNSFTTPTNFGQQSRNSLTGPSYTDVNLGAFKTFEIPHYEFMKLKLGAQFFNLFNHPNFQNPSHTLTSSSAGTLGSIASTVGAPTSILGSTGGADASPRLIQLHASLTF